MNCTYVSHATSFPNPISRRHTVVVNGTTEYQQHVFRPDPVDARDGYRFFWHADHAKELQHRLHQTQTYQNHLNRQSHDNELVTKDNQQELPTLRIGLVNRLQTRRIGNMHRLIQAIRHEYPHAVIENVTMEDMTPLQQFTWWNQQSIVLLPHGAATTNLLFLQAGSAVIEIFPPHYYWWGFWKLAQSVHVRYYGYFPKFTTEAAVVLDHHDNNNSSSGSRSNLTTPILPTTIIHKKATRHQQQKQQAVALYQEFLQNCQNYTVQKRHQNIKVLEPSIPHVLVLLRRAVTEGPQHKHDRDAGWSSYVPQIARLEPSCTCGQSVHVNETVEFHVDDDPPQFLLDQYG